MAVADGALLNSPADIILDCLLTASIFISFLPQALRILRRESSAGISPVYLLFNGLYACWHACLVLLHYSTAYTSSGRLVLAQISSGKLHGSAAVGALMGLVQASVQTWNAIWIILLAAQYMPSDSTHWLTPGKLRACVLLSCASIVPSVVVMSDASGPGCVLGTFFVPFMLFGSAIGSVGVGVYQFIPQHTTMRSTGGDPGALSLTSLCLRSAVDLLLGFRWMQRTWPYAVAGELWWSFEGNLGYLGYFRGVSAWSYLIEALGLALLAFLYKREVLRHGHHRVGFVVPQKTNA